MFRPSEFQAGFVTIEDTLDAVRFVVEKVSLADHQHYILVPRHAFSLLPFVFGFSFT